MPVLPKWAYEAIGVVIAVLIVVSAAWIGMHEHDKSVATQATSALRASEAAAVQASKDHAHGAEAKAASDTAALASTYKGNIDEVVNLNAARFAAAARSPLVVRVPVAAARADCSNLSAASASAPGADAASTVDWTLPDAYRAGLLAAGRDADDEVGKLRAQNAALQHQLDIDREEVNGNSAAR